MRHLLAVWMFLPACAGPSGATEPAAAEPVGQEPAARGGPGKDSPAGGAGGIAPDPDGGGAPAAEAGQGGGSDARTPDAGAADRTLPPTNPPTIPPTTVVAPPAAPCPGGSRIEALTPTAGVARHGSLYSTVLYQPKQRGTHQPRQIEVRVTGPSGPLSGCDVRWEAVGGPRSSGWVFPDAWKTDATGVVKAWWLAGAAATQTVQARIALAGGGVQSVSVIGTSQPHATRANSIHINWSSPRWDAFRAEVCADSRLGREIVPDRARCFSAGARVGAAAALATAKPHGSC